jgi:hypothetical protein
VRPSERRLSNKRFSRSLTDRLCVILNAADLEME